MLNNTKTLGEKNKNVYNSEQVFWNQWLAGIIDGNGYFYIQKNGVAVCEITMPVNEEPLLAQIKQKLGGRLIARSGIRAVRYRLSHKKGMVELISKVNGWIRNNIRAFQFQKICSHFNISFLEAKALTKNNGYIAGFFDAQGTICMIVLKSTPADSIKSGIHGKILRLSNSRDFHKLEISISNKYKKNLICFQEAFGFGHIRSNGQNKSKTYVYYLNDSDIPEFIEYTKKFPLRSTKRKRIWALKQYFDLKRCKAHLANDCSIQKKAWVNFCKKWYS